MTIVLNVLENIFAGLLVSSMFAVGYFFHEEKGTKKLKKAGICAIIFFILGVICGLFN